MLMVGRLAAGWTVAAVARALGTSPRTVRQWRDRFAVEGEAGLRDRSSRPHRSPTRLPAAAEAEIARLRQALAAPDLYARDRARFDRFTTGLAERQAALAAAEEAWLAPELRREALEAPG